MQQSTYAVIKQFVTQSVEHFVIRPKAAGIATALICLFMPLSAMAQQEQPIAFSHQLHATQNQIPCQYCHIYARRSFSSGVPPMSVCVGCHGTKDAPLIWPDSVEVNKMRELWAKQEPIPWVKIHDIPDYVRFPHKQHINADSDRFKAVAAACDEKTDARSIACMVKLFQQDGDDRCAACHGSIKTMPVIKQVDENFGKMGWCLTCHLQIKGVAERKSAISTLGGWFNAKQQEEERAKTIELKNPKGYHNPLLTDCYTCHY